MRRVPQRDYDNGDCGIACVAMISGQPYERVHSEALMLGLRNEDGEYFMRHGQIRNLLSVFGIETNLRKFVSMRQVEPMSIVAVNPKEGGYYWHWVVLSPSRSSTVLLDPKPGKPARIERFSGYRGVGMYVHAV
ncbi:cysteine peptidase family C39 domain-containing protein [Xanthomonas medicagonis]|uniref:cysteine peptidase family C39 domain-containing protein n=1 Tax=Xanthomonas medicagonis TaxID=3160841 RepID=UPI003512C741